MGRNTDISSAYDAVAITPGSSDIPGLNIRAIMVGADGDVNATFAGGNTVVLKALKAGVIYPFQITRVVVANTTATDIVGLR